MRLRKLPEVAVRAIEGIVAEDTTDPDPLSSDEYGVERAGTPRPRPWRRGWRTLCEVGEVEGDEDSEDEYEFDRSGLPRRRVSRFTS